MNLNIHILVNNCHYSRFVLVPKDRYSIGIRIPYSSVKVHKKGHAHLNRLVSGLKNMPYIILEFCMTAKRFFPHEFLDFSAMKSIGCFDQILQDLEDFCHTNVFAFKHPWNREIILQFYATLYISGDETDSSKWILEWMTEGKRIKCTSTDFVSHFHFARFEHGKNEIRVHNIDVISDEIFRCTMDKEKNRDYNGPLVPEQLTIEKVTPYH